VKYCLVHIVMRTCAWEISSAADVTTHCLYFYCFSLFTNPSVSFAYERGWRQGFASAGFPGPDKEAELAMEYFAPAVARAEGTNVLIDMSCATGKSAVLYIRVKPRGYSTFSLETWKGLFTRRFTKSGKYDRVIGCDYSDSMLSEARRRIRADPSLSPQRRKTQLDLVRCDVGRIPMKTNSVDAFHAGAAMHCWPELPLAASEIHRVLKPGGR
jgi:ubiquinone/menaquinone biosynthesis C-methylase UbiE